MLEHTASWKMNDPDEPLRAVLRAVTDDRACEVGLHDTSGGGHSPGPVKHFLIFRCPRCFAGGCLSCCKAVGERVARNPVWMVQCNECSYAGSRYIFKTEVRGI